MIGNRDYSVIITIVPFGLFCIMVGLIKLCIKYECLQHFRKNDGRVKDDNLNINAEGAADSVVIIVQK